MSTKKRFTEEQMQILMANPYVKNVTYGFAISKECYTS